jgi:hypothetical protein
MRKSDMVHLFIQREQRSGIYLPVIYKTSPSPRHFEANRRLKNHPSMILSQARIRCSHSDRSTSICNSSFGFCWTMNIHFFPTNFAFGFNLDPHYNSTQRDHHDTHCVWGKENPNLTYKMYALWEESGKCPPWRYTIISQNDETSYYKVYHFMRRDWEVPYKEISGSPQWQLTISLIQHLLLQTTNFVTEKRKLLCQTSTLNPIRQQDADSVTPKGCR